MSKIEDHIAEAQHASVAGDGEEECSRGEGSGLTSASAQTNRTEKRRTNLEMGGAAQYISMADMINLEGIECDDEAVRAREVEEKKRKMMKIGNRVLSQWTVSL